MHKYTRSIINSGEQSRDKETPDKGRLSVDVTFFFPFVPTVFLVCSYFQNSFLQNATAHTEEI